jgi:hypothetical protein
MANSFVQLIAENWIRDNWLPKEFGQSFQLMSLQLAPGGRFKFDAVSEDSSIIVNISTSSAKTARGKHGSGKIQKIRADMLLLLMAPADKRLIVLTEIDMFNFWEAEKRSGRVPVEIEFLHVELPPDILDSLVQAQSTAADEVTPLNLKAKPTDYQGFVLKDHE